jgi:phenylacetate-CoA ligase
VVLGGAFQQSVVSFSWRFKQVGEAVGVVVLSVEFKIRDFAYPMGIIRLRRFFERSQWMDSEALREYQRHLLRRTIRQAYFHVPYYAQLFDAARLKPQDIRDVDDLWKLPVLSKEMVRANYGALHADNAKRFRPSVVCTSGTTGEPLRFLVDKPSNILEFVHYWRHWSWAGYRLGDRFAQLRYDFFVHHPGMRDRVWHFQPHLQRLLLNLFALSRKHIGEFARVLRAYRPKFLHGLPAHLRLLAEFLKEKHMDDIQFRAVFSGGEKLTQDERKTVESAFACKVLDSYGHMERSMAVSQCLEGGYHIHPEYGILELIEQQKLEDGVILGRVVSTSLHRMAMPFLRYDLEDLVELFPDHKRCPCGRTLPLLKTIHGRKREGILTSDGRDIAWVFVPFQYVRGVRFYQYVQEQLDRATVRIVKEQNYAPDNEKILRFWFRRLFGDLVSFKIEYVSEKEIELDDAGKPLMLVRRLNRSVRI